MAIRMARKCDDSIPQLKDDAHVAQSAERVLGKDEVISSILIVGSTLAGTAEASGKFEEH